MMGHCLVCIVEPVNIFLKAQALLKRSASTFSSFSALLHLVFTSPTNWERHGWYIRPLSRHALCTPPRDLGTPDKTTHSVIGYDHLNINNPASGSTPFTLTRSGPRPWSLSGMFILCPLFHNYSSAMMELCEAGDGKCESRARHPGMWMVITHKAALKVCQTLQVVFFPFFFSCFSVSHLVTELPPSQRWSWEEAPNRLLVSRKALNSGQKSTPCNTHHKHWK